MSRAVGSAFLGPGAAATPPPLSFSPHRPGSYAAKPRIMSRIESINDVFWFATQSGILLWFWTGDALIALAQKGERGWKVAVAAAGALLVFPVTLQHFILKRSLDVDRVPASVVAPLPP